MCILYNIEDIKINVKSKNQTKMNQDKTQNEFFYENKMFQHY